MDVTCPTYFLICVYNLIELPYKTFKLIAYKLSKEFPYYFMAKISVKTFMINQMTTTDITNKTKKYLIYLIFNAFIYFTR